MKTLIVIDFQKDFANPNGTLYVPGAERAEDGICSYIMKHNKEISDVVFTVDWHTFDDLSFKVNEIPLPVISLKLKTSVLSTLAFFSFIIDFAIG